MRERKRKGKRQNRNEATIKHKGMSFRCIISGSCFVSSLLYGTLTLAYQENPDGKYLKAQQGVTIADKVQLKKHSIADGPQVRFF